MPVSRWKTALSCLNTLVALAVFLFCSWSLVSYCRDARRSQSHYEELAQSASTSPTNTASVAEPGILPEYTVLYQQNPHLVGWIKITGTQIDYPVVQTPEDPEYYMYRDFSGTENPWGCIFADGSCDVNSSDNVTLYGHHMVDGSMFTGLMDYDSQEFLTDHPTIIFNSLTQQRTYRIFAVFRTTANMTDGFAYHKFVDAECKADFDAFISRCTALSHFATDITPEYGDQLLCLSTCEYSQENGRFVVVAVLEK